MPILDWLGCSSRTGRQVDFLPELTPSQALKRTLGQAETCQFTLPLATAPDEWELATRPMASFLVALVEDAPVYGALTLTRTATWSPDPDASLIDISAVTVEGYAERRFVGDVTYTGVGQNQIFADLAARYLATDGIPIRTVKHGGDGTPRSITYHDVDDRTVLSAFDDLAGLDGGPDWTVEWERTDTDRPTFTPVLHVGDIGEDPRTRGLTPVTFYLPGAVTEAQRVESWEAGKAANRVTATGQRNGDDRDQATVANRIDTTVPLVELRGSVPTDNDDDLTIADLTAHAQGALNLTVHGSTTYSVTANVDEAPPLGSDADDNHWQLGDVLAFSVSTPDGGGQGTFYATGRCVSWEWDTTRKPETITPVLLTPEIDL